MFFLFSGEGETDFGTGRCENLSEGDDYLYGPLTILVDQIICTHLRYQYSIIDSVCCGFVSKSRLVDYFKTLKPIKKPPLPRGELRNSQETKYFRNNARALAAIAKDIATAKDDDVVAILFRDSDRTRSTKRTDWQIKWDSMINGFQDEQFPRGVPMIPKSISESWILCSIYRKTEQNRNCDDLEDKTFGSGEKHQLKIELKNVLNAEPNRVLLNEKAASGEIHFQHINLKSFEEFKNRLEEVI